MNKLQKLLQNIEGKSYKAYKDIKGSYHFDNYTVTIDHVQGDPFAAPSRVSLRVSMAVWKHADGNSVRCVALEDFIARSTKRVIKKSVKGRRGSGCSGTIDIATSGQQILRRNAIIVDPDFVEARIVMGLPANGRRAAGLQAIEMFFDELPIIVNKALMYKNLPQELLLQHVASVEDQQVLRDSLNEKKLVAFIANGSILPRSSGVSDKPLDTNVVDFQSPSSLEQTITLPNGGKTALGQLVFVDTGLGKGQH